MNITKKKCFCHQCSLQFDNEYILSLHLKVVHKQMNSKGAIKCVIESNRPISSDKKSDSNNQIALGQKRKKTFKCELCQYFSFQRDSLQFHLAKIHEGEKPFKCEFCNYTSSEKPLLKRKHILH